MRQEKGVVVAEIARLLGVEDPGSSTGSTVTKEIFLQANDVLGLGLEPSLVKTELAQGIVESSGEPWLPSYESTGSTVTNAGLRAVLEAVRFFTGTASDDDPAAIEEAVNPLVDGGRVVSLSASLAPVEEVFQEALLWFHNHRGEEVGWPGATESGQLLVSKAKGIYKPAATAFALSVRQNLNSPYADRKVIVRDDGTWVYAYHQEGHDALSRDDDYTNRALMENLHQVVPVGVLHQTAPKPATRYKVLGLALVTSWRDGYFFLEGFNAVGLANYGPSSSEDLVLTQDATELLKDEQISELDPAHDARVRVLASVVRRQGQGAFRDALLATYSDTCVISGCKVTDVLDAAHIQPYRGSHTDHVTNGILLRTDLHSLFDRGLLAINPSSRTVLVASSLDGTEYSEYQGQRIIEPQSSADRPSGAGLSAHLDWCGDRLTVDREQPSAGSSDAGESTLLPTR